MGHQWLALAELLLVLGWAQVCYADFDGSLNYLPGACSAPSENAWWSPISLNNSDPCEIHQRLIDHEIYTACCSAGPSNVISIICGPCTQETYNIVMACFLCVARQTAFLTQPPDFDTVNSTQFPESEITSTLGFGSNLTLSAFKNGPQQGITLPFTPELWMHVEAKSDLFDAKGVVAAAVATNPLSTSRGQPAPPGQAPLSTVSPRPIPSKTSESPGDASTSPFSLPLPHTTLPLPPKKLPSPPSKAGIIAGGTIGGVILVGAAIFLAVFIRKRQRKKLMISEENPHTPSEVRRNRLTDIDPYIIDTPEYEKIRESIGSVANSQERPPSISPIQDQDLAVLTRTNIPSLLAQTERRAMDAGHVSMGVDEGDGRTLPPDYEDVFREDVQVQV